MSHKTHILEGNNLAGRLLFPVRAERRTNQPAWCPVSWMRTARQRGPQGHVREVHPLTRVRYGAKAADIWPAPTPRREGHRGAIGPTCTHPRPLALANMTTPTRTPRARAPRPQDPA